MGIASATVASASAFEWSPAVQQPNPSTEVTQAYQLETLRIAADYNLVPTDVMPKWIDEDGNEIIGAYSSFSDPSWGEYNYEFNFSDFKSNGEYTLQFPEGMLKNAAGELSDPKVFYYTVDIEQLAGAMFDDFKVLSITPDLSEAQALWSDQVMTINTNHNEAIGYTVLSIFDKSADNDGIVFSNNLTTERALGSASPISWEVVGSYKFYEGHQYSAEITFYHGNNDRDSDGNPTPVVAKATYEFTGKVEGFKYSDIKLLEITPAPGSLTISEPEQAVFTYTFSGPVNVYRVVTPKGQNGNVVYPSSCFKSNDDKTVWTIDLSGESYIKTIDAELALQVYARDLDGYQVKGNFGEESASCFEDAWPCDLGGESLVVVAPASGESIDRLTEVVVKSENGESMTWSNVGQITVETIGRGQVIATLVYERPESAQDDSATEFRFTKWVPEGEWSGVPIDLVAEGSYVINISSGCFVFGDQFTAVNSRSLYSGFSVTGALDDTPDDPVVDPAEQETFKYSSVDPENGSTVDSLETIKLTFPEEVAFDGCEVKVYDAGQNLVTTGIADYDWDQFLFDVVYVKLAEPIEQAGAYEVVIPARTLCNNEYSMSDGKAGACNPEFRLNYTVGSDNPDVDPQEALQYAAVTPEVGSTVKSLDTILLSFAEPVACEDVEINVLSADQTIAATGICRSDFSEPTLIVVKLNEPVTAAGRYNVVIPARKIINGDYYDSDGASGLCNPEYHLFYTIEGSVDPGVDPSEQEVFNYTKVDPADGSTVEELSNISLWFPDVVVTTDDTAYVYKAGATESDPVTTAMVNWSFQDDYLITVALVTPVSEAGEYVVVIPARTICDDAFFGSDGNNGICNPEIRLSYTVNPGGSGVASVVGMSNADVYDLQGRLVLRNASVDTLKTLTKGVYVVNGRKLVVK
ncbi:MAG: T9SS type A sorting domain-containing protein [Muribaculaceae bacterium]|nr:T9SS type A sorting domain-containing protein [Muribaculaceae bacterium]